MDVIIAGLTGFCSGVQKAIEGSLSILRNTKSPIYCLGDIIHNHGVVNSLRDKGMQFVSHLEDVPDHSSFIIRSHGLPHKTIQQILKKRCTIHDFTCPKVKKTHHLVAQLTKEKKSIVILGNLHHPEVEALLSLTNGNAVVVSSVDGLMQKFNFDECHVVVQTTFNPSEFFKIITDLIRMTKVVTVHNTLCEETVRRQQEAIKLAERVEVMIVVGGRHSSNTRTLYEISRARTNAYHIETAEELETKWFTGVSSVGIVSGASTPKEEVMRVYEKIHSF